MYVQRTYDSSLGYLHTDVKHLKYFDRYTSLLIAKTHHHFVYKITLSISVICSFKSYGSTQYPSSWIERITQYPSSRPNEAPNIHNNRPNAALNTLVVVPNEALYTL